MCLDHTFQMQSNQPQPYTHLYLLFEVLTLSATIHLSSSPQGQEMPSIPEPVEITQPSNPEPACPASPVLPWANHSKVHNKAPTYSSLSFLLPSDWPWCFLLGTVSIKLCFQ
jgi:hypothetical protein